MRGIEWAPVALAAIMLLEACLPSDPPVPDRPYVLAPGDVIRIFVPRRAELSGEFALDCQGYLVEPLGVPLLVAGLTTRQLEDEIEADLKSDGYMDEPRVSVTRIGGCVF
jgi:protein involved in polysaccharide export with SLBB domain